MTMATEEVSGDVVAATEETAAARFSKFFLKFFCEGQATQKTLKKSAYGGGGGDNDDQPTNETEVFLGSAWLARHRKPVGLALPVLLTHAIWWSYMASNDKFDLFAGTAGSEEIPRWYMSITMVFGSMLAGATSEGGAAVAFPVMTLIFGIAPSVARDFSYLIQSVGMTAASFTILWMGVLIEHKALVYVTLGGVGGVIFGLEYCTLDPPYAKMYFVSIWGAFAAALYYLNTIQGRKVYLVLDPPHYPAVWASATLWQMDQATYGPLAFYVFFNWKAAVLVATGFLGGIFSSISGSGIDICSFAVLTLFFRVSEKTATPTSVILMAVNTCVAFLYREYGMECPLPNDEAHGWPCGKNGGGMMQDAYGFFLVCAPIVCFGAPFGSVVGSFVHRLVLAWAVYLTDSVQLVAALVIVQPWVGWEDDQGEPTKFDGKPGHNTPAHLTGSSVAIFVAGLVFFHGLQRGGEAVIAWNDRLEAQHKEVADAAKKGGATAAAESGALEAGEPGAGEPGEGAAPINALLERGGQD